MQAIDVAQGRLKIASTHIAPHALAGGKTEWRHQCPVPGWLQPGEKLGEAPRLVGGSCGSAHPHSAAAGRHNSNGCYNFRCQLGRRYPDRHNQGTLHTCHNNCSVLHNCGYNSGIRYICCHYHGYSYRCRYHGRPYSRRYYDRPYSRRYHGRYPVHSGSAGDHGEQP